MYRVSVSKNFSTFHLPMLLLCGSRSIKIHRFHIENHTDFKYTFAVRLLASRKRLDTRCRFLIVITIIEIILISTSMNFVRKRFVISLKPDRGDC